MPDLSAFGWDAAALVVALCALYLTIKSNKVAHQHNRLSVMPRLSTTTASNMITEGAVRFLEVRVTLTNVGLGPAVVKKSEVLLDGNAMPVESFDDVRPLLEQVFPGIQLGSTYAFFKLNKKHALQVGKEVEIVAFQVLNPRADFDKEIKRFNLRISYESLYGDPLNYDSRDHLQP
ncbi:MAG: hypothetical protein Q8L18_10670 [Hydrogenophaga sp.]|nr:hypothetical protein [Hydrogenophaga sp.]